MKNQNLLVLVIVAVILLVLVACQGLVSTRTRDNTGSESNIVSVQGKSSADESAIASLDADAIVAAYEQVLGNIYESVLPSVVHLKVEKNLSPQGTVPGSDLPPAFERFFGPPERFAIPSEGSGFIWSDKGYVVTNHHVIENADQITVIFANGTEFSAAVLGSDPDSDLAVLKIEIEPEELKAVELGESGDMKVGQLAVAIGSPFGQEFTMTRGIISALGRLIPTGTSNFSNPQIIQTDAPINPGNSGGPLLDRHGYVIGITSQILSSSGTNAGVGFAIPINTAKRIVPELITNGKYKYAYLGISGKSLSSRLAEANGLPGGTRGALVVQVVDGSPASKAGLIGSLKRREMNGLQYPMGGDVIMSINDVSVKGIEDLISYMAENSRPGDKVTLEVIRQDGDRARITVTLGPRPESISG